MSVADTDPAAFRTRVVAESIRLFSEHGYESTTVEQLAAAAGMSRRTFFRQFGSKEDVIFADHESLLAQVGDRLAASDEDPWLAVCAAAELVFAHFVRDRELAVRRAQVVQEVPALRDRELVTTYRYQGAFEEFLRARLPGESPVRVVAYVAAVTGTHNFLLRQMIRGDAEATPERLRDELHRVAMALGAGGAGGASVPGGGSRGQVTVVAYPAGMSRSEVARRVAEELGED
ncbi:TetR family transcriptional regulator [Gordonia sp. JH63]|uniref:TetR family transcriptional regulator n=1 Tax=Gordonia TaxID=2053 RepID=UPI00099143E7|nr:MULTISPECIES: TetR family transcriptional regulator [unclassified Gordonia (in: high G+C Gram-positive bacteria)]MCZ4536603.1 TetR family transcriptional regulator [Gordonia terrae]MBN0972780.1 TetR family transcriptional regulator [Gordonia sp. BP-119]MBN0982916.1 TetR family transcriptional regulator [Gordonia sp. BP-94]MDT0222639.1 TetR family transcriptional regulator [Gordonia sp. AC31]QHD84792.1 TetR family transcriptional regulator [Gordonia sp. JH63]